ncbi:MAG: AAA family ATPase, partial [Aquificae bacterium]|nr:AAA family ATPase [Aquificota bacterium]
EKIGQLYKQKEELIQKQKNLMSQIKEEEDRLTALQNSLLPIKEKEGSITSKIRYLDEKKTELQEQVEKLTKLIESYNKEKEEKIKEILSIEEEIKALKEQLPLIQEALEKAEQNLEEKNKKLKEIELGGAKAKVDLGQLEKEEKQLQQEIQKLEKEKLSIQSQLERIQEKVEEYKQEIQQKTEEIQGLENSKQNIKKFVETQEKKIKSLSSELQRLRIRKESLLKKLKENREKIEKNFQKLAQVLAQLSQVREDKTVALLKDVKGVYGQVADLIGVKIPEYQLAVEVAGGGRLKHIVVEDDKVAEECIRILKETKSPRATFIPLNRIKVPQINKPPLMRGVIGLAIDFVDYDPAIEKAVKYVFGDTVIVENFDAARTLGIGSFRMVSLEGDLFEKSGTITGGFDKNRGTTLGKGSLEQEKIKLEKEDDRLKQEEALIEEELKKIEEKISLTEKELYHLQNESQTVLERHREIEEKLQQNRARISHLENTIVELKKQQFELEGKLERIDKELSRLGIQLQETERKKREILEQMENEGLHRLRKEWEEATQLVYTIREKKNDLENQIEKLTDRLENSLKARILQIEREKEETNKQLQELKGQIQEIKDEIQSLTRELSDLWKEQKGKEKEREEILTKLEELKSQLKLLRSEEEEINKQITYLLEDKGKYEQKVEDIKQELMTLKQEYQGEAVEGDLDQLERELKEYQKKRQELGAVNQKAIQDYDTVKQRYEELNEKLKILIDEKKSIEELIQNLEEKKIKAFMEVFNSVNKNLNKIFKRLSPGGRAYLEIENEEDPLSGGILLKAKPRGKDVKRLEIMSGGEKTLTALAFLFAVQQYRPAPFYYFDEVDAHLDDANARKIAELMKELSKEAQFIVVTLRDTMASYADRLIGVSAREGISNVYTLNMEDIKQAQSLTG